MKFIRKILEILQIEESLQPDSDDSWILPDNSSEDEKLSRATRGYLEKKDQILDYLVSDHYREDHLKELYNEFLLAFKLDLYQSFSIFSLLGSPESETYKARQRDLQNLFSLSDEQIRDSLRKNSHLVEFYKFLSDNSAEQGITHEISPDLESLKNQEKGDAKSELGGALREIERIMAFCRADRLIDEFDSKRLFIILKISGAPVSQFTGVLLEIQNYVRIFDIRQRGILPIKKPPFLLRDSEYCRWFGRTGLSFLGYGQFGARELNLGAEIFNGHIRVTLLTNMGFSFSAGRSFDYLTFDRISRIICEGFQLHLEITEKREEGTEYQTKAKGVLTLSFSSRDALFFVWEVLKTQKEKQNLEIKMELYNELPALSRDEKYIIWQREKGQCRLCSVEKGLTFEWIPGESSSATHRTEAITLICRDCHLKNKGNL